VASPENSALVVVDMETGTSRRILQGHSTVVPEPLPIVIGDTTMAVDEEGKGKPSIGVDAITIDTKSEWVYYGAAQSTSLWRIRTADLADESLSDAELATRIERYGNRPICDGITIDGKGNVYITDITNYAIGVVEPSGSYRVLFRDEKLLVWPDGMSFGPDGYIYVVANQLHLSPVFNMGKDLSTPPYYVLRFKSLADGAVGR
jgi:sugar lactone lactonase YvrE